MIRYSSPATTHNIRRDFIGGSDGREGPVRLGQEKRGEVGPEDLSGRPSARSIGTARASLWFGVLPLRFPKSDSCSATVFLDELDAGGLDGFPESDSDFIRHSRTKTSFQALYRRE
jgi:hypothetical protein